MNLKEYKTRLDKHDWYYMMSDDRRAYEAGQAEENELRKLSEARKTYKKAYDSKVKQMFPKKLKTQ